MNLASISQFRTLLTDATKLTSLFMIQPNADQVWRSHGRALGDCICSIMVYAGYATATGRKVPVSTFYMKRGRRKEYGFRWRELLSLFDLPGTIELVDIESNACHHYTEGMRTPFRSTKVTWNLQAQSSGTVAYQFDGKSHRQKNFQSKAEEDEMLHKIMDMGYKTVRLSKSISLSDCVTILAGAAMFIGVDSGFSHLAHCVGTPIVLAHNREKAEIVIQRHENKHFMLAEDGDDAARQVEQFRAKGMDYYIRSCKFPESVRATRCA